MLYGSIYIYFRKSWKPNDNTCSHCIHKPQDMCQQFVITSCIISSLNQPSFSVHLSLSPSLPLSVLLVESLMCLPTCSSSIFNLTVSIFIPGKLEKHLRERGKDSIDRIARNLLSNGGKKYFTSQKDSKSPLWIVKTQSNSVTVSPVTYLSKTAAMNYQNFIILIEMLTSEKDLDSYSLT